MKERSKDMYIPSYDIADIYTGLGDKDQAIEWLEKAYEERSITLFHLKHPIYDILRSDPRFNTLLKKTGMKAIKQ
ncbi:MAG: tetratricopeptide repeat protein [Candidatus Hodarchaeota archaeon]